MHVIGKTSSAILLGTMLFMLIFFSFEFTFKLLKAAFENDQYLFGSLGVLCWILLVAINFKGKITLDVGDSKKEEKIDVEPEDIQKAVDIALEGIKKQDWSPWFLKAPSEPHS